MRDVIHRLPSTGAVDGLEARRYQWLWHIIASENVCRGYMQVKEEDAQEKT
jgi:hypothetical protein